MYCKNRVTLYFDNDRTKSFRVLLATLEQVNAFIQYIRRCTDLEYLSYTFESQSSDKERGKWDVIEDCQVPINSERTHRRTGAAPFKMTVKVYASRRSEEFAFDLYCFSSLDLDFLSMLIEYGASMSQDMKISYYNKNKDTREWVEREPYSFVPKSLADVYKGLSPQAKELAVSALSTLE